MSKQGELVSTSQTQRDEAVEYRAVSAAAVGGLLLGIVSPLALLTPALWLVPGAAVILSIVGLRSIRVSEGARVGRKAAVVGLVLALLFGSAAVGASLTRGFLLRRHARYFAQQWIDRVVNGDTYVAHQLCERYDVRKPLDAQLANYYRDDPAAHQAFEGFISNALLHSLLSLGRGGSVRYLRTGQLFRDTDMDAVEQFFLVSPGLHTGEQEFVMRLIVERQIDPRGMGHWRVSGYERTSERP